MAALRRVLFVACLLLLVPGLALLVVDEYQAAGPVLALLGCLAGSGVFLVSSAEHAALRRADRRARAAGIRADGLILSLTATGRSSEDSRLWEIAVRVTLPGAAPYVATVVSTAGMYERPGRRTPVTVAADDPQRIWIEYEPGYR